MKMLSENRLFGCLSLLALLPLGSIGQTVEIPDPSLEAVIRELVNHPEGDLTVAWMSGIYEIRMPYLNSKIASLEGLENAANLFYLGLPGNAISDLSPLAGLTNLERIYLGGNRISDIEPILQMVHSAILASDSSFKSLFLSLPNNAIRDLNAFDRVDFPRSRRGLPQAQIELHLGGNQITDITPLAGKAEVVWLDLSDNPITDVSPLSTGFRFLASLNLARTLITDVSAFAGKRGIIGDFNLSDTAVRDLAPLSEWSIGTLNLSGCQWLDLESLPPLYELSSLDLSRTPVVDLAPLSQYGALTTLRVSSTGVKDLSPLSGMYLNNLDLSDTDVVDLVPLGGMKILYSLNISNSRVSDLSPLVVSDVSGGVRTLDLSYSLVRDFSPLKSFGRLFNLSVGGLGISDLQDIAEALAVPYIHPISGEIVAGSVGFLDLRDNPISDLAPLTELPMIRRLTLSGTDVVDLSPLVELPELTDLDLSGTPVIDLTPLTSLVHLSSLYLNDTNIEDFSPLASMKQLDLLHLNSSGIEDLSPLTGTHARYLGLRDNQIRDLTPLAGLAERWLEAYNPNFFQSGFSIDLRGNNLDTTPGSAAREMIEALRRVPNATVLFEPQRESSYLWAEADVYGDYWRLSGWYGWVKEESFPWCWSPEHGWQFVSGATSDNVWMWDESLGGWYWTSADVYPWIYLQAADSDGQWLLYQPTSIQPLRWFYAPSINDWIREDALIGM